MKGHSLLCRRLSSGDENVKIHLVIKLPKYSLTQHFIYIVVLTWFLSITTGFEGDSGTEHVTLIGISKNIFKNNLSFINLNVILNC